MKTTRFIRLAFASIPVVCVGSQAALAENLAPAGFTPNAEAQVIFDDNPRRAPSGFESSDWALEFKPELPLVWRVGKHQFDVGYKGDWARYTDDSDLSYGDHHLYGHMLLDHTLRLTTEYNIGFKKGHDAPGSTDVLATTSGDLDEWDQTYGKAEIRYGRDDGIGQIIASVRADNTDYTNNNQDYRDRLRTDLAGAFYYRLQPNTRALIEIHYIDSNYDSDTLPGIQQDNTEIQYLAGLKWKATYQTTGIFKVGYRTRSYDNAFYKDIDGLALSAEGYWRPNSFTRVKVTAEVKSEDSATVGGNAYNASRFSADLKHGLTARTTLTGGIGYGVDTYDNGLFASREDKFYRARIGLVRNLVRWLDIGAELRYEKLNSNRNAFDYDSKMFLLTAKTLFE